MTTYTTGTVARLLSFSRETIRTYCEEFERHLSTLASPGEGKHKSFTDHDLKIMRTIADMKRSGRTYAEIHAALDAGAVADLPDMSVLSPLGSTTALSILERRVNDLSTELQEVKMERDELRIQILPLERENAANKALRESAEARAASLEKEVRDLIKQIGRLEAGGSNR